ncbi:fibroblast growth factor 23-like [Polyodon spathula]|nr:fibroblast growth factor 23-like [Polyodon spathula]
MHSALLILFLAVLRGFQIGSTLPVLSPLLNPTWGDPKRLVHLYTSSDKRSFHLAINPDGQVDRTTIQTPSSAMLLKSDGIGLMAIMGVKSERYLCMDANGKTFSSAVFSMEYCLFQHERLENGYDVYHSPKSNLVLNLDGRPHTYIPGGNLPPYSQFISLVNTIELEHFVRRRSTSFHVDPSDPFGMFTANSQPATGEDSVETQASSEVPALSRERTRSTYHDEVDPDDPWRLLDHKTNSSPRYSVSE